MTGRKHRLAKAVKALAGEVRAVFDRGEQFEDPGLNIVVRPSSAVHHIWARPDYHGFPARGEHLTPEVDGIHAEMVNQLLCPAHAVMSAIHQAYDSTNPVDAAEALSEACEELTEYRLHLRRVHDEIDKNRLAIIEKHNIKETQP